MTVLKSIVLGFCIALMSIACSKENRAPDDFVITAINVRFVVEDNSESQGRGNYYYVPVWTEAIDPDGDEVVYSLFLENVLIAEDISALSYEIEDIVLEDIISEKTEVAVFKVVAQDSDGATSEATFTVDDEDDFTLEDQIK